MIKNSKLQVILNNLEESKVRESAKQAHLSLSAFIRNCIFKEIDRGANSN